MDAASINKLLRAGIRERYRAKVGTTIVIELPRLPIIANTEFIRFDLNASCSAPFETAVPDFGEGNALPNHVTAYASRPGSGLLRITAVDALTEQTIPDVIPLEIELTAVREDVIPLEIELTAARGMTKKKLKA